MAIYGLILQVCACVVLHLMLKSDHASTLQAEITGLKRET